MYQDEGKCLLFNHLKLDSSEKKRNFLDELGGNDRGISSCLRTQERDTHKTTYAHVLSQRTRVKLESASQIIETRLTRRTLAVYQVQVLYLGCDTALM